jgi:predicted small lipoprotein YifL
MEELMRPRIFVGIAVASVTLVSCGGKGPVEINPQEQVVANRWNATLATPSELAGATQVKGTGWMGADKDDPTETRAHVSLTNAVPGGEHPWHVHIGRCGADKGIFGPTEAYSPIKVESDGTALGDAELEVPMPASGEYFINVHASANNMRTIVACGNLAPPVR